ncbi:MAG TPA: Holliday junction branch migration protein RuvA, partial [Candidatus Limnocylindria bacterium]|nr:Holliday junction branch migration protein RuvA [Candidatus Limnocylindria bacterium]
AFLEGIVAEKTPAHLTLNVQGVGYLVFCSQSALTGCPAVGEFTRVYTWLSVREDALELFGFSSSEERAMFLHLNGLTGIGPRTAMSVVSSMPLKDLTLAILTGDLQTLSRAPGIGRKTAQRIAMELKDKFAGWDVAASLTGMPQGVSSAVPGPVGEAIQALAALGYTQSEAALAISRARQEGAPEQADELVRHALRGMLKG